MSMRVLWGRRWLLLLFLWTLGNANTHDFSQHKADALDEPETCKGSKAMCGDSVFDQADREAKQMKEEALKKIADAVEREKNTRKKKVRDWQRRRRRRKRKMSS